MGRRLHRLRRRLRRRVLDAARRAAPDGCRPLPDLRAFERVLLVLVNFRLGNTVLATPAVAAFRDALPRTRLDFLGGPTAPVVMRGLGLERVLACSRLDVGVPWRLADLVGALRAARYDAAIHLGPGGSSLGGLLVALSGAPHRIGCERREGNVYFTSALPPPRARHKVDQLAEMLAPLGIPLRHERLLALGDGELREARARLAAELGGSAPVVALFLGGRERKGKAWPLATARRVVEGLDARGLRALVMLGPEELGRAGEIAAALPHAHLLHEPDLRRVAALLARCLVVVSPDAGPMHLAIAAGTPTVGLFRRPNADKWGPRPPHGLALVDPEGGDADGVLAAVDRLRGAAPRAMHG